MTRRAPGGALREPLVLFVGLIFNRRRLPTLVTAFAAAAATRPEARLVIAGADRSYPALDLAGLAAEAGVAARVEIRQYVSEPELESLYSRAAVFVFLSEYEGFGLTPLEALSAGIPIVVLDTPVAREVYGDAAWYVPQENDVRGAANAIRTLLDDPASAAPMLAAAPAVLARYSWDTAAADTLAAIEGIVRPVSGLSIVIVSFNARADLQGCLLSLKKGPPSMNHEIIVVDNDSGDGSAEAAERIPGVRVIRMGRNAGFSAANNAGIRESRGDLVLLLNSDTLVPPGVLDHLTARLLATGSAGIAGPRLVDADGQPELSFGRMISPLNEFRQKRRTREWIAVETAREQFVDWVSGACLLVRRADAEAVGLLNERFFLYTEDVDFCHSVRKLGLKVLFTPVATITHLRGRLRSSQPEASRQAYRRSHVAFYEKHHPVWAPLLKLYLRLKGEL